MKKKFIFLLLCFILLFTVACGGENNEVPPTPTTAPTATATPLPTPTPTPVNAAKEALDNVQTTLDSVLTWNGTYGNNVDIAKGIGYDYSVDISVNQMLLSLLGLEDLRTISLDMTADMNNEVMAMDMILGLNEDELLDFELFFDYEKLLYNIPKYSTQYGALFMETETSEPVAVPDMQELLSMYQNFLSDFFGTFQPVDGYVDNASLEQDGYKVTGQKFTVTADLTEMNDALNKFVSDFQAMYPDAETEVTEFPTDEYKFLVFDFYKGADGTFAWECYPDTVTDEPLGLISAENGFCFYVTTEGATKTLLRSEKSSATEGTVYFTNDETEMVLLYTLGENSIVVSEMEDTFSFSCDWEWKEGYVSMNFSILTPEFGLSYNVVSEGPKGHVELALSSYDTQLVKLSADFAIREFQNVTMPENYVDEETWSAQMDTDAFLADLEALFEKYPALESLFGTTEDPDIVDGTGDDWTNDDWFDDDYDDLYDYPEYDPTAVYENEFMDLTGYSVDEYGNVDFIALESEVLALGVPSTGIIVTDITDDQRQALIDYGTTAFADSYADATTSYQITGNVVDDSVESFYYTEYWFSDNTYYGNVIDLYIEAISGDFYSVDVYNASRDEAFRMANDLLVILGEEPVLDASLDETALYEGVWVGNYLVYSNDYGDYYCISIY